MAWHVYENKNTNKNDHLGDCNSNPFTLKV